MTRPLLALLFFGATAHAADPSGELDRVSSLRPAELERYADTTVARIDRRVDEAKTQRTALPKRRATEADCMTGAIQWMESLQAVAHSADRWVDQALEANDTPRAAREASKLARVRVRFEDRSKQAATCLVARQGRTTREILGPDDVVERYRQKTARQRGEVAWDSAEPALDE